MTNSKEQRRLRAEARQREREQRTPTEQLAVLDGRLGDGAGAESERARLGSLINHSANERGVYDD